MAIRKPGTSTQPFSIRLGPAANLLVTEEVRRTGRSRSAVVNELAEEAAKMRLFPGVGFRGQPRRAWVVGSGLDVWQVIDMLNDYKGDVARLCEDHGLLTERYVKIAQAYAERFPEEIEPFLTAQHRPLEELLELYPFLQVFHIEE